MELFLELASTIAFTLMLCYIIDKLISSFPNGETEKSGTKIDAYECNFGVVSVVRDLEIEEQFKVVESIEHKEEPENFTVEEFVSVMEDNGGKLVEQERNFREIEVFSSNYDEISASDCKCEEKPEKEGVLCDEKEDDWVGIERTKLERLFGKALVFVGFRSNYNKVSRLKMKLYGLQKIVTQGHCLEPQPMALKVSARAKWNACQQLGEMTPEMAMEQYVLLLSENVPGWMRDEFNADDKQDVVDAWDERKQEELRNYR